jgi:hypothetical protein
MAAITSTNPATKDTLTDEGKTWIGDTSLVQYAQSHPELPIIIYSGTNNIINYISGAVPSYYEWIQEAYDMTNVDFQQGGHLGRDYLGTHEWTSNPEFVFHKSSGDPIDLPLPINTSKSTFLMPALSQLESFYTTADTYYWEWEWNNTKSRPYKHGGLSIIDMMNDNGYTTWLGNNKNSVHSGYG